MKIAICDDEEVFAQYLRKLIFEILGEKQILCSIDLFYSGSKFLDLGIDVSEYDIVFLDINMEELDGIATAKELRKFNNDIFIVFVTAFINYTLEGYKVDAIRYILKNTANFELAVKECFNAILDKMSYEILVHRFDFRECSRNINIDNIIYIESKLHRLYFYTMENGVSIYTLDDTLNDMESVINSGKFVRIHQSYLVNMKFIKCIKSHNVILKNNECFPIAKLRYQLVIKKYTHYKGEI